MVDQSVCNENGVLMTQLTGNLYGIISTGLAGADPGEVKWVNFHPPFSEPPSFSLFLIPQILTSNTSTRLLFYYIITKIHPPFQNPGSAPDLEHGDRLSTYVVNGFLKI